MGEIWFHALFAQHQQRLRRQLRPHHLFLRCHFYWLLSISNVPNMNICSIFIRNISGCHYKSSATWTRMLKLEQHEICPLANLWFEMWWRSRSSLVSPSPLSNNKHDQHIGLLCLCCTISPGLNCSVLMCLWARADTSLWSVSSRPFQAYLAVATVTLLFLYQILHWD